jgi:hypothetical protein
VFWLGAAALTLVTLYTQNLSLFFADIIIWYMWYVYAALRTTPENHPLPKAARPFLALKWAWLAWPVLPQRIADQVTRLSVWAAEFEARHRP